MCIEYSVPYILHLSLPLLFWPLAWSAVWTQQTLRALFYIHGSVHRESNLITAYAQHILRNQHEYGTITDTLTLLKPIHKTSLLIPYEQLFIQTYQYNGTLITEQNRGGQNPLFQLAIDTNLTSRLFRNEYLPYDTHESVPT